MSEKPDYSRINYESRLSTEDRVVFQDGVGLIRTKAVDPQYYNTRYFSGDHV